MQLKPLYLWLVVLNVMCLQPFSYGPLSFACLITSIAILWKSLPATTPVTISANQAGSRQIPLYVLAIASMLIGIAGCIGGLLYQPQWLVNMGGIIDIGANTYAATEAFAQGLNPYTSKAQLWVEHFPVDTPHLAVVNGQITMYGIPYFHGYPYFPLMLLSYLPAYFLVDGHDTIRVTHIVLILLNLLAFKLLLDRMAGDKQQRRIALLIAITAYLGLLRYTIEAVLLGVTDILISTYLLFCFVALSRERYLLAGILLGCAQACKLLPAPFVLLGIIYMLYEQQIPVRNQVHLWRFLGGFALACAVVILPFFLWHPEGFLSSTILYYLTHHQGGDTTSLWFFLPQVLQMPFLVAGVLLTLTSIVLFGRRSGNSLVACMAASYASYAIFMAFSKMTHLNYLWGVFPLGCLALAMVLSRLPAAIPKR